MNDMRYLGGYNYRNDLSSQAGNRIDPSSFKSRGSLPHLSSRLEGFIGMRYSRAYVETDELHLFLFSDVSATNPCDRLGIPLRVTYVAGCEARTGLNPISCSTDELEDMGVNAGLIFAETFPPMRVRSRITWDLAGYHECGADSRVSAGVRNLFDEKFPFHQDFVGPFDTRRVDLRGRLMHIELRKDFSF